MYAKRRTVTASYGKGRVIKEAQLLWDEAIVASPIKPYLPPSNDIAPTQRKVLASIDINLSASGGVDSPTFRQKANHIDADENDALVEPIAEPIMEVHALNVLDSPLRVSTPTHHTESSLPVLRTHIKFPSSNASPVGSISPIAQRSSQADQCSSLESLSSIDDDIDLEGLAERLQKLTTDQESDEADQSTAKPEDLQDIHTLMSLCNQLCPEDFDEYITSIISKSAIQKLGEASFSEVFLGTCSLTKEETVYKVIPFGEAASEVPINDVIQELRISCAMSTVAGFVKIKGMRIVQGKYPAALLDAWDEWTNTHETESDRPDWYTSSQRYCVVMLENGGVDLEHYEVKSWIQARQLLRDIVKTLACGEREREFEHRDLHWGNILVRDGASQDCEITIIDYTLSRALVHDSLSDIAFYGFSDRAIFEAEGDDYQFEIYRYMRDIVSDGQDEQVSEDWTKFHPSTNALWTHYLVDKLLYAKNLSKPVLRVSKRHPIVDEKEVAAWKDLQNLWTLLDPRRKYKIDERPIDSACRVLELIEA